MKGRQQSPKRERPPGKIIFSEVLHVRLSLSRASGTGIVLLGHKPLTEAFLGSGCIRDYSKPAASQTPPVLELVRSKQASNRILPRDSSEEPNSRRSPIRAYSSDKLLLTFQLIYLLIRSLRKRLTKTMVNICMHMCLSARRIHLSYFPETSYEELLSFLQAMQGCKA